MKWFPACPLIHIQLAVKCALTLTLVPLEQGAGLGPLALVPRVLLLLRIPQVTQQSSQLYPAVTTYKFE